MSEIIRCPKCGQESGDDWSQCDETPGGCPMDCSPAFNSDTKKLYEEKAGEK